MMLDLRTGLLKKIYVVPEGFKIEDFICLFWDFSKTDYIDL